MRLMALPILGQSASWSFPVRIRVASTALLSTQTLGQLQMAHLQREQQHRLAHLDAGVGDHPQGEAGLTHGRRAPTTTRFDGCRPASCSSRSA